MNETQENRYHEAPDQVKLAENQLLRRSLFVCGWFFTILAFLGAILPLLPTTPFLLAAAACFYRSSERFYRWILFNRFFGHYLRDYRAGRGIPMKVKVMALLFTWSTTLVSAFVFVPWLWLKILLIVLSAAITLHLMCIRTRK